MADNKTAKPIYASQESLYEKAVQKMNADQVIVQHAYKIENYLIAASMFEEAGDYLDAPLLARQCRELAGQAGEDEKELKYQRCIRRLADEDPEMYPKVLEELRSIAGYKDTDKYIKTCEDLLNRMGKKKKRKHRIIFGILVLIAAGITAGCVTGFFQYMLGIAYFKTGSYTNAQNTFRNLEGFLSADEYAENSKWMRLAGAGVDDTVEFGDFRWKVMHLEDDVMTLMAVDVTPDHLFYEVPFNETGEDVTWEDCTLREWLNKEVYEEYFSDDERELMLLQTSQPSENEDYKTTYTGKTEDYLTILSVEEASGYKDAIETMGLDFWFRTPGHSMDTVCYISAPTHTMHTYGCPADQEGIAVRPVILVDRSRIMK